VIPFFVRGAAGTRSTAISPPLVGPLIIETVWGQFTTAGNNPFPHFQIFYGRDDSGRQVGGVDYASPADQKVWETPLIADDQNVVASLGAGMIAGNVSGFGAVGPWRLAFPIFDTRVFLKFTVSGQLGSSAALVTGACRVLEGLTEEDVANFL